MGYSYSNLKKDIILINIMGSIYMGLECLWRGKTDVSMLVVGGVSAFLIGRLNEHPMFCDRKMWQQCIIGTLIILVLEFTSGMILNVWLGLDIWDYSREPFNLHGQICLSYTLIWFMLVPFCVFVDDFLRYKLYKENKPKGVIYNYKQLFILQ